MTLELLRPWGCEVAPGEMPVVCASLVLEQCPQRTQGTMVDLGVTHVCEWLLVLSCLHMDFHTWQPPVHLKRHRDFRGDIHHKGWSLAPKGTETPV